MATASFFLESHSTIRWRRNDASWVFGEKDLGNNFVLSSFSFKFSFRVRCTLRYRKQYAITRVKQILKGRMSIDVKQLFIQFFFFFFLLS